MDWIQLNHKSALDHREKKIVVWRSDGYLTAGKLIGLDSRVVTIQNHRVVSHIDYVSQSCLFALLKEPKKFEFKLADPKLL